MDLTTAHQISALIERVVSLRADGDLNEALRVADTVVVKSEHALSSDPDTREAYVSALRLRGELDLELGSCELACDDFNLAIEQLHGQSDSQVQIGQLYALLGSSHDGCGQPTLAAEHWRKAMVYFENQTPPPVLDIAAMANNLGFLCKAAGDLGAAKNYFLKALDIVQSQFGEEHEQTATICNNLGALYQASNLHQQALEMHTRALDTRRNLFGERNPDTAQSHNNLALALFNTGDYEWPRRHFESALFGFQSLGKKYHDDLEVVALNYCDLLRIDGDHQLAREIAERIEDVIGHPIGS
jgi:tetratricopeptide (TPR) repeat protein